MADLSQADREEAAGDLMRYWSSQGISTPILKEDALELVKVTDDEMNAAETRIYQTLSDGQLKTWLFTNQGVARESVIRVMAKRREVFNGG